MASSNTYLSMPKVSRSGNGKGVFQSAIRSSDSESCLWLGFFATLRPAHMTYTPLDRVYERRAKLRMPEISLLSKPCVRSCKTKAHGRTNAGTILSSKHRALVSWVFADLTHESQENRGLG
jgi:hypothetical protein